MSTCVYIDGQVRDPHSATFTAHQRGNMNIAVLAHRFFLFGGAMLVAIALLQLRFRRRAQDGTSKAGQATATMVRVVLFTTVGILAILVGTGVVPMARLR
jgi:hypothetical protein